MRYTSEKIDFEKAKEIVKKNGFSEKAKKCLGVLLLTAQIAGIAPNIANAYTPTNSQDFEIEYANIDDELHKVKLDTNLYNATVNQDYVDIDDNLHEVDLRIDNSDKVIDDYGKRQQIDRDNLEEFKKRDFDTVKHNIDTSKEIPKINGGINDYTIEDMQKLKEKDHKVVILGNNDILSAYYPEDMIMLKEHYEKYYAPIAKNTKLTQKEKFHAAMQVLNATTTYDHAAYKPKESTEYSEAAQLTSRGLYSAAKYGTTICARIC